MPPLFTRRAVIPSDSYLAEHCEGSVDDPFLKAPIGALSSFSAAMSEKRNMGEEGSYPSTVNEVFEDFSRIFSAPDSRARKTLRTVTPLI